MDILICMFLQHIFTMITYSHEYINVYIFVQYVYTLHTHCLHANLLCSCGCIHIASNMYTHCIHIVYTLYATCIHTVYTRKCIPAMCIPVADKMYL